MDDKKERDLEPFQISETFQESTCLWSDEKERNHKMKAFEQQCRLHNSLPQANTNPWTAIAEANDYITRLKDEYKSLSWKMDKLTDFLINSDSITKETRDLLDLQLSIMMSYKTILAIRLMREEDK